ncbi:MAG TPA: protein kinase, partial [Thermoanaerobaculia bacterium]|nr:protein kinase [Thermoanaerobaculia bacterium]
MTLTPGTKLGPYEILSPLGAGGMGEVYKARDVKLGREVAIKVLPDAMARDADRLARFEREARSLAALNHPNIVTIYAVEESGETRFLAMELVEGRTLDVILGEGVLELPRFFDLAVPLAEALSAAHERGIVHRDLKPGNVMMTAEGRVKVLDFGLARVQESDSNSNLTSTPTESRAAQLTSEGQVFGTVAYMSPEQARGARVDARSDVFSLGVVLYEMLTGERPFRGSTSVDLISSILRDRPVSVMDLRADVPPDLSRVLRRSLEKEPRDRYQTSRDVYNELRELRSEIGSGMVSGAARPQPRRERAVPSSGSSHAHAEIPWIAVLPFQGPGSDAELEAFADGLAEGITTGLSRFRYLSVVSRASTPHLKGRTEDVRTVAAQLGARYVVEGSVRKSGASIRVSARLIEASTGTQLWAGTYDRDLQAAGIFDVQDNVAARIVATIADSYGVLVRSLTAALREKSEADLSSSEWLFQYFAYRQLLTPPAHAALKGGLERAVQRDARQSDLWGCLALVHTDEYTFGFQADAATLDRALAAARRAAELDRTNPFALLALAQAHFFRQELVAFHPAAEQAMALNPLNTDALGILGLMIVHTGEFQRGAAIVRRAMELNPSHAGWFHFAPIWEHFERGEYERALEHAMQVNMPGLFWQPLVIAAICGQLGRRTEAAAAVRDLLALDPDFGKHARRDVRVWHFASGLLDRILDGVRNAGLEIADEGESAEPSAVTASSETRTADGFWIAVLPLQVSGVAAELAALAEGLSEQIASGLSRFSYLRVISRGTTLRTAADAADGRAAGKELGARYVLDGSLRQAATRLRIAVQLVDTQTGAQLWSDTYDQDFRPEAVFEIQDALVPRIVSTVADMHGVLPRSMSDALRHRPPESLSPREALLRSFGYFERVTPDDLAASRSALELAVRKEPAHADAWAMLGLLGVQDYAQGFGLQADALERGFEAARRAVDLAPTSALAHFALAQALFFRKELEKFRHEAERTVSLNPMDGSSLALVGEMLAHSGQWKRGLDLSRRARELNPHHPGWYWYPDFYDAYNRGDYPAALEVALKIGETNHWGAHLLIAAACAQLGDREAAAQAVQEAIRLRPRVAETFPEDARKWFELGFAAHLIDGLRKAGLDVREAGKATAAAAPASAVARVRPDSRPPSSSISADEGFWVAVLPFRYAGADAELTALAEALTEDVVTGLSRFPHLRVIARSSTARYASESVDVRSAGTELGARYVIEGSVRSTGNRLRVAVQLVDAETGAHLWAETYDRDLKSSDALALQDDLTDRIVATVADTSGALIRSMAAAVEDKPDSELKAADVVLRHWRYQHRGTPAEHLRVRDNLEKFVEREPGHASVWACLGRLYVHEYCFGFNARPQPLERALRAAQQAVDLDPACQHARNVIAQVHFFRRDVPAFRAAAEHAVALNPRDTDTLGVMGNMFSCSGDFERGPSLVRRAMELNPHAPDWLRFALVSKEFHEENYEAALDHISRANMPGFFWVPLWAAACYGLLGRRAEGAAAVQELRRLDPDIALHAREFVNSWLYASGLTERYLDGLRRAGLEIAADSEAAVAAEPVPAAASHSANEAPVVAPEVSAGIPPRGRKGWIAAAAAVIILAAAGMWISRSRTAAAQSTAAGPATQPIRSIAVLPLDNYSGDPSQDYFAEG